ncbi:MAG: hypothetical protein R3F59_07195 [Myxococcota bacterium]
MAGSPTIPAGGAAPVGVYTNRIPDDTAPGSWFLLAKADELDTVEEPDEWNNLAVQPITIGSCGPQVVQLTAGLRQTCALLDDGAVRCRGSGQYGTLGYGDTLDRGDDEDPADAGDVPLSGPAIAIEAGGYHTCAILDGGDVQCWGRGTEGQLGYADTATIGDDEPASAAGVVDLGGAVALAAGAYHTCALLDTGAVRCWGQSTFGQLGYGDTATIGDDEVPASAGDVPIGATVVALDAGDAHTCAVTAAGGLRCWGYGGSGNLGYGDTATLGDDEPAAATRATCRWAAASSGSRSAAPTPARSWRAGCRCWGQGGDRLGRHGLTLGDDKPASAGGNVPVGATASAVVAGGEHTCALTTAGGVRCWGSIVSGGLGYASAGPVPRGDLYGDVIVGGPVVQLASGYGTICALLDGGSVRCWGNGAYGKLGYASTDDIGDDEVPYDAGDVRIQ